MTVTVPVHPELIPFLDKMEVRYSRSHLSPVTPMIHIDLEISGSNLISYGIAQRRHGISMGMKYRELEELQNNGGLNHV